MQRNRNYHLPHEQSEALTGVSLRLSLFTPVDALRQRIGLAGQAPDLGKRYNIAPGQEVAVLVERQGSVRLARRTWGLIPANAHHAAVGAGLHQVRRESLLELAAMRERLEQRRCAVLADGFFLWQESPDGAQPWYFYLASREPFALAALWELWAPARKDPIRSCTIVTAPANQRVAPIQQRMPVILARGALATWLDSGIREPDALLALCRPYAGEDLEAHKVGLQVENEQHDSLDVIDPIL